MKSIYYKIVLSLVLFAVVACKSDVTDMGASIQPEGDKILVKTDTVHLSSDCFFVDSIFNRPDSLLLGTFIDEKYGTIQADILARFEPPFAEGDYRYPSNAKVDSAFLVLPYASWFGASNSTMAIKTYEITKEVLNYYTPYSSNANIEDYIDLSNPTLLGDTVFAPNDSSYILVRLFDDFTQHLFDITKSFETEDEFFENFSGMYITTELSDATMVYLQGATIILYYHYEKEIAGKDTVFVKNTNYVVNSTVINRFQHPDSEKIKVRLDNDRTINYVSSPANFYTQIDIPLRRIVQQMQDSIGDKRLVINSALVKVEAIETENRTESSDITVPIPSNMLLVQKSEMNNFFASPQPLPTDSAIYANYSTKDSCYTFNIAPYLTKEIKKAANNNEINISEIPDKMEMILLPIQVTSSTDYYGNTTISAIKQQTLINGVTIRSGQDLERPMKMNLLFSGF